MLAKETGTDIPPLVGDPTVNGATLRVLTDGATPSDEFYDLPAALWYSTATAFIFRGGQYVVQRVVLRRTPRGVALMRLILKGNTFSNDRDLTVVPPNPGTGGRAVLSINNGGDRYCASYGGAAGGTINPNTDRVFKVNNPTAQPPCPPDPSPICCDFGTQEVCGWADNAEDCIAASGNVGDTNSVCDSATGLCTPPPADPGFCCEGAPNVFGTNCTAGPLVGPTGEGDLCTALGGTLFSSAVCTTAGDCASPSGAFVDPPEPL